MNISASDLECVNNRKCTLQLAEGSDKNSGKSYKANRSKSDVVPGKTPLSNSRGCLAACEKEG